MANTKKYVSLDKLGMYDEKIKKVITDGDAAALASAKSYADGLAVNYDTAGSAATVQGKLDEEVIRAKAREDEIAGLVATAQGEVDALETYVGTIPAGATATDIVGYVQEKTAGIATDTALAELQGTVDAIEADYLKAADKTELSDAIATEASRADAAEKVNAAAIKAISDDYLKASDKEALQAGIDAVSEVANAAVKQSDYNTKVAALDAEDARIEGLVTAEAERAAGVEADFESRIATMEVFWETTEDADGVVNTLKEIQDYIAGDETGASEMLASINKNKEDIAAHVAIDHDFAGADATLKSDLEAKIEKKADKTTVEGIDGRLTTAEGKITAVEGRMDTAEGKISALEEKFGDGEGSVADMIADAVKVEEEARKAADDAIEAKADQGIADAAAALKAAQEASAHADSLNTAMDARMQEVEAKKHEHANKALLDTYTQTEENLADAVAKKHEHANKTVLDGIDATKVAAWDAAEGNAKTFAQGLNDTMDGRVASLESWHENFVECSQEDINGLFTA